MKKLILILTLIFALTLCFVACEELGDNSNDGQSINAISNGAPETEEPTTEAPTTEKPTSEAPTEEPTTEKPTSEAPTEEPTTEEKTLGDTPNILLTDDMEFVAETLVQRMTVSHGFSLDVKVVDEKLYLCDILHEEITYTKNEDINFDDGIISGAVYDERILSIFKKIKNQENCYLIDTRGDIILADYFRVYYIDGVCYFVSFAISNIDGKPYVHRIHYAEIE